VNLDGSSCWLVGLSWDLRNDSRCHHACPTGLAERISVYNALETCRALHGKMIKACLQQVQTLWNVIFHHTNTRPRHTGLPCAGTFRKAECSPMRSLQWTGRALQCRQKISILFLNNNFKNILLVSKFIGIADHL